MTDVPLISRKLFFGNPDRTSVQLSPDGRFVSWLAALDGVLNVWVAPAGDMSAARAITHDAARGVRFYLWAFTSRHILYFQDENGDENWHIFCVDQASGAERDLSPFENTTANIYGHSLKFPSEIVIGLNNRDPRWHDVYRANIETGDLDLLYRNDRFGAIMVDDEYRVRFGAQMTAEGGMDWYVARDDGDWELWLAASAEDALATSPGGFNKDNSAVYLIDSRGRNTSALYEADIATGRQTLLAEDHRADVGNWMAHPVEKTIQAVSFTYDRKRWVFLDKTVEADFAQLQKTLRGEVQIEGHSLDYRTWIAMDVLDDSPARFYLYDRDSRTAAYLFSNRKALEDAPLARMNPVVIRSRDGLDLVCYYTLPVGCDSDGDGVPDVPLPMVLNPHGGPWHRDAWGYNAWHQWLANRGYAVLSVNFRASTGLGKSFANAGDREWGGKIIDDQVDAVHWAIASRIADPKRIAIMGGSFGGFSTLAGMTMHPELYACGVDLVGPSNLVTFIESVPPYWRPMMSLLLNRVGDPNTPEGLELLKKHSPITYVDRISKPLLIAQGANDPRVKKAESDQIVAAMQAKGLPVTYLLYPDEGHGFARPENNLSFYAVSEAFLAKYLGGRREPVGDDFQNSSLQALAGSEEIPAAGE